MGPASITITIDRYRHLLPGGEAEAAALLDPARLHHVMRRDPAERERLQALVDGRGVMGSSEGREVPASHGARSEPSPAAKGGRSRDRRA
jgi:hypothetical protein